MRRSSLVVSVILVLAVVAIARGRAQAPDQLHGVMVFAPNATRTVTFSKEGAVVASFEVPKGNALRVFYDDSLPTNALSPELLNGISAGRPMADGPVFVLDHVARFELHGDISVRALSRQQFERLGPGVSMDQAMNQAPLNVTARGVDVVIAGVE